MITVIKPKKYLNVYLVLSFEINVALTLNLVGNISGCVWESGHQGLSKSSFKYNVTTFDFLWIGVKVTLNLNIPGISQPGMPPPGHLGGVNWFEW